MKNKWKQCYICHNVKCKSIAFERGDWISVRIGF